MPRKFSLHATISVCRHTDMVYSKPKNSGIWHTLIKVVYPLTQRKILAYLDLGGGGEGWPRAFAPQGHGLGVSRPPEPDIFNCIMGKRILPIIQLKICKSALRQKWTNQIIVYHETCAKGISIPSFA